MKKLAIVTTHPIQYNAPWFKLLSERKKCVVKVFYTWGQLECGAKYDPGFGKNVEWDIPLLEGYEYTFVKNISRDAGSHHFKGINNPSLINEIDVWKPDALLVFGWSFKSHLNLLRHYRHKIQILFRGDSVLLDEPGGFSMRKLVRRVFLKWVYRNVDIALYAGSANRIYFKKHGLSDSKLVFAPHAVDNNRFAHVGSNLRMQLGIHNDAVVFLFAGKLEAKKNPDLLLAAFIKSRIENAHLVIIGNGELEPALKNTLQGQNTDIRNRIHLMDFQNQSKMPGIYHSCDVFVLPSRGSGETWGLAVNEAMAASLPVLVSDKCGCYMDLVKDGVNGYVFESGNINDLHNKMQRMAEEPARLAEMGRESLHIIHDWSFTHIAVAIEQAISYI